MADLILPGQGDPRWSRRRLLAAGVAGVAGLALAGCSLDNTAATDNQQNDPDAGWGGDLVSPPLSKPDVTFTTTDGKPYDIRKETAGKLTFLFFGYTKCPDQCPVYLSTLARSIDAVATGPGSAPIVLFVGIDLKRDTPKVLAAYLKTFNDSFIGLTGSEHVIAKANREVKFAPIVIEAPDKNGDYGVGHTARAIAYTPDNKAHRLYGVDVRQQDLAKDLPRLAVGTYR